MVRCTSLIVLICLFAVAAPAAVSEGLWEPWAAEVYNLEPGEAVQFRVSYDDLQVRSWILSVEGGLLLCDVNVLRLADRSLLYQQNDESRHKIKIPWGRDESIAVTLTADTRTGGSYTVKFLAPPSDQTERSYGYTLNRALEALAAGDEARAESIFHDTVAKDDEDAGIGCLMLASLLKNRGEMERAAGLMDMALRKGLPADLDHVESELRKQLAQVRNRLSPLLIRADLALAAGDGSTAMYRVNVWLEDQEIRECSGWELCEAHRRLGHAWHLEGDLVRAQGFLDQALRESHDRVQKALVYHRLGLVLVAASNPDQARRALEAARDLGLPPDLNESTEIILNQLEED